MKTLSTILATAMTVAFLFTGTSLYLVSTGKMVISLDGVDAVTYSAMADKAVLDSFAKAGR